jgi:hypothetical protein
VIEFAFRTWKETERPKFTKGANVRVMKIWSKKNGAT